MEGRERFGGGGKEGWREEREVGVVVRRGGGKREIWGWWQGGVEGRERGGGGGKEGWREERERGVGREIATDIPMQMSASTVYTIVCVCMLQVMSEAEFDGGSHVQALLEYLHERETDLETMAEQKRMRLEQCVQLRNFETEARQVRQAVPVINRSHQHGCMSSNMCWKSGSVYTDLRQFPSEILCLLGIFWHALTLCWVFTHFDSLSGYEFVMRKQGDDLLKCLSGLISCIAESARYFHS